MAKLDVPPTKSTYLELKRSLAFAQEGFDLLEDKRQILILELMSHLARAKDIQKEVERNVAEAFAALKEAQLSEGSFAMTKETLAIKKAHNVMVGGHRIMGLNIPKIEVEYQEPELEFGFGGGSSTSDRAMKKFFEALKSIERIAETENAVFRLSRELKKTQRRVNALEKIFIPSYQDTIKYIVDTLEERERDNLIIMKKVKEQREEAGW